MCGITGVLHFDGERPVDLQRLKSMTDIIRHRGPDGEGFFVEKNIGLGHRRLSIIDLETGDQPMYSDDGQKVLVFNGEIYNYIELREELKKKGYHFQTNSDTEVVIKAYEEWGYECQNKFNGMWAFALWDKSRQELFLSRDRIGEKPLHYAVWNNSFVFGSEMKALFAYGVPNEIDYSLVELYLVFAGIPEPFTFYKNINKLKAGHYIVVAQGSYKEYQYWDLPEIDEANMISDKNLVYDQFDFLFRDAVKLRMRSDVPYGAFLSGGLDSSSVVSVMSEISAYPVNTFTIGFPEKRYDESKLAAIVAKKFNTIHNLGTVMPDDFDDIVEKVVFHFDEPFGDSSAIPTGYVSKFAAEKVKMVLTGDGGDEILSGYNSYAGIKLASIYKKMPIQIQKLFPKTISVIKKPLKGNKRNSLNHLEEILSSCLLDFNKRMLHKKAFIDFYTIKTLTKKIKDIYPVEDFFNQFMAKTSYKDEFYRLMFLNFKFDLPNDYLVKVDRMSMAHSLETRIPFLDYRLIEFMVKVDKNLKMQGWERKSILKKTIGNTLPKKLLNTPKKGFTVPLNTWFKETSFTRLSSKLKSINQIMDTNIIQNIIKQNQEGVSNNGNIIWQLIILNKFINLY